VSEYPVLLHTAIDARDGRSLAEFYRQLLGLCTTGRQKICQRTAVPQHGHRTRNPPTTASAAIARRHGVAVLRTPAVYDEHMPEVSSLVGIAEVAQLAGVSRAAVTNWRSRRSDFPAPVADLRAGPVFDGPTVMAWLQTHRTEVTTIPNDPGSTRPESISHALLPKLAQQQSALLEIVSTVFQGTGSWPNWRFVEYMLHQAESAEAADVLASLPSVGAKQGVYGLQYGLVRVSSSFASAPQPGDIVGLTIAGWQATGRPEVVALFLDMLALGLQRLQQFVPSPDDVTPLEITSVDVALVLSESLLRAGMTPTQLYELMEHEPAWWGGSRGMTPEGAWRWEIPRDLRRYRAVTTITEYLDNVTVLAEESMRQLGKLLPPQIGEPAPSTNAWVDRMLEPDVPLLGSGIDAELWEFVRPLVEAGRWEQVAREAAAFVETRLRLWTGSELPALDLAALIFGGTARTRGPRGGEGEGWQLLARGFFLAVRNHVVHNALGVEHAFQFGLGALGAASLLVQQARIRVHEDQQA